MARRWILLAAVACGCAGGRRPVDEGDGTADARGGGGDSGNSCIAPDMLVLLDRTMSMSKRPDGSTPANTVSGRMQTKWYLAVTALEQLTVQFTGTVRFGLALFPRDPGGGKCVTLSQKLSGKSASNGTCKAGEVVVVPDDNGATMIASVLDPETTTLCTSTPIGAGLGTAQTALAAIADPIREQYVLFVGDGNDTCDEPLVLANVHALATAGVRTFVVAFDGSGSGIDNGLLNDMACAGQTAPAFPAPCKVDASGRYLASDRDGPPLYLRAEDQAGLATGLAKIIDQVCCGCVG